MFQVKYSKTNCLTDVSIYYDNNYAAPISSFLAWLDQVSVGKYK